MHYIVLDLEWNQPTSTQSAVYRRVGDSLIFEVIQIGAVKVDDAFRVVDSLSIPIKPTYYTSIHPRVKRMTGLNPTVLADAPAFPEAMEQFCDWCGDEYVFVTWGCDDVSVLQQNIDFFGFKRPLPKMYDLQRYYAKVLGLGQSQKALKSAMEQLEIDPDEERSFHNALDDAYYTALVLGKLPTPDKVLEYEETPRKLGHGVKRTRLRATHMIKSVAEAMRGEALATPECPACKQRAKLTTELIYQAPGKYVALAKCAQHGELFVRVRFGMLPDGQKGMNLSVGTADRQTKAYVHTKLLQYQYRCKRGDFDGMDIEALDELKSSNMPFED